MSFAVNHGWTVRGAYALDSGGAPRCRFCWYNLTGLPDNHRCPECGSDYDIHMVVLLNLPSQFVQKVAAGVAALLSLPAAGLHPICLFNALCFVCTLLACAFWTRNRPLGREGRIVLSSAGVEFCLPACRSGVIAWSRIAAVEYRRAGHSVRLLGTSGDVIFVAPGTAFVAPMLARDVKREIEAQIVLRRKRAEQM